MSTGFERFDRPAKLPHRPAPDFAVLLAGLSACQLGSETARYQIVLDHEGAKTGCARPVVSLFAHGSRTAIAATQGSFSADVAKGLAIDARK